MHVDPTTLSKWSDIARVREGLADRVGLRDHVFQGAVSGLGLSSDYFFVDDMALKRTSPRARVVQNEDGSVREAERGELDAQLFVLGDVAERLDRNARQKLSEVDKRASSTEREVADLRDEVRRLTELVGLLIGKSANNG